MNNLQHVEIMLDYLVFWICKPGIMQSLARAELKSDGLEVQEKAGPAKSNLHSIHFYHLYFHYFYIIMNEILYIYIYIYRYFTHVDYIYEYIYIL